MRIAQVVAGAPTGGAELFFERLTVALHRGGDAVLPVIRRNGPRAARLSEAGVRVSELRFGGPADLLTRPRLRALLRRFEPRVVVAWMSRAARFAPNGEWVLAGRLGGYYDLSYYRRCDHLIGNTRGIARWIVGQGWPASRVHYLPNFVTDYGSAIPADRARLGLSEDQPLVLALGRLHRNKAFDVLVRALPHLPRVQAAIAGDGPERDTLASMARQLGVADRLHLIGWQQDVGALLAAANVLVCPSRHEPLGNVVIEAWSARRPVVATVADGPRELISGNEGVLVPLEDPIALARALTAVLTDRQASAARVSAGRARFEADFAEAPVLARWRLLLGGLEKA